MNNIACIICREIIAVTDFRELSLPLTAQQFRSPRPENGIPDPFPKGLSIEHWKCPYCNSYPLYGFEAGEDTIPYELYEYALGNFKIIKVEDIINEQAQKKDNSAAIVDFQTSLVQALKTHKPLKKPKKKKTYKCKQCGKKFNHPSSLSRHKKKKGHR